MHLYVQTGDTFSYRAPKLYSKYLCENLLRYGPVVKTLFSCLFYNAHKKKKEGDLTQSYGRNPHTTENSKTNDQHKNATKNFDYTTIADRLRTVS